MADLVLKALPPAEAIAYFKAKGLDLDPTFSWLDKSSEDHAASFTVAKSSGFDILKDVHDAVLAAQQNGTTWETFRDRLTPILQDKGWWGRQTVIDPVTGQPVNAQLGSVRRLQTIFNVNMRMSYAAGNWAAFERNAATRPFLRYTAVMDSKTRPAHRAWHGTILPIDHPWWQTHAPPCGWNCRCRLISLSESDLTRYGYKLSPAPPADPQPPMLFVNKRTGERSMVPYGIDPGFAYNPGKVAVDQHAARVAASKWADAPADLTAAQQAASIDFLLPALTRDFGNWVDGVKPGRLIGDVRIIGAMDQDVLDYLKQRGLDVQSGAISISDRTVLHMDRSAKPNAIGVDAIRLLPESLAEPISVYFQAEKPTGIVYVYERDGVQSKIIVGLNFAEKSERKSVLTNAIITADRLKAGDLKSLQLQLIKEYPRTP